MPSLSVPDGNVVLTASNDRTPGSGMLPPGEPLGKPLAHQDEVLCAAFSPDGKTVAHRKQGPEQPSSGSVATTDSTRTRRLPPRAGLRRSPSAPDGTRSHGERRCDRAGSGTSRPAVRLATGHAVIATGSRPCPSARMAAA